MSDPPPHDEIRRAADPFVGEAATDETFRKMLSAAEETIRSLFLRPRERTRAADEADIAALLYDQMLPLATHATRRFLLGAAQAGAYVLAPFVLGLPEGFDPRERLGAVPDGVLALLCARFAWGDGFPSNLIHLERMRRDGKIADWGLRRESETAARCLVTPNKPAEFITVDFSVSGAGEAFRGE